MIGEKWDRDSRQTDNRKNMKWNKSLDKGQIIREPIQMGNPLSKSIFKHGTHNWQSRYTTNTHAPGSVISEDKTH